MAHAHNTCCVPGCGKSRHDSTLHSFPNPEKEGNRFRTWVHRIGGDILSLNNQKVYRYRKVCDEHFEKSHKTRYLRLSKIAVPALFVPGFPGTNKSIAHQICCSESETKGKPTTSTMPAEPGFVAVKEMPQLHHHQPSYSADCHPDSPSPGLVDDQQSNTLGILDEGENRSSLPSGNHTARTGDDDVTDKHVCTICHTDESTCVTDAANFKTLERLLREVQELWLCKWCVAYLYKVDELIQWLRVKVEKKQKGILHNFSQTHNPHIDIPPENKMVIKQQLACGNGNQHNIITETVYLEDDLNIINDTLDEQDVILWTQDCDTNVFEIDDKTNQGKLLNNDIYGNNSEFLTKEKANDKLSKDESNNEVNTEYTDKEIDKKVGVKRKRRRVERMFAELNFTARWLTEEQQRQEIEEFKKTEKYRRMYYHCTDCAVGFLTEDKYKEHRFRHIDPSLPYSCAICTVRFATSAAQRQHALRHARRMVCGICGAQFARSSLCTAHRAACPTAEMVRCDICDKLYRNMHALEVHLKGVHLKEKKYICDSCDKRFYTKTKLEAHIRTHSGSRPYRCRHCARAFAANSNLRAHQRRHAPRDQFYCVQCDAHFAARTSLARHLASAKHNAD